MPNHYNLGSLRLVLSWENPESDACEGEEDEDLLRPPLALDSPSSEHRKSAERCRRKRKKTKGEGVYPRRRDLSLISSTGRPDIPQPVPQLALAIGSPAIGP